MTPRSQRGAFLLARALLLVGILLAMLAVPAYMKYGDNQRAAAEAASEAQRRQGQAEPEGLTPAAPAAPISASAADAPRPIGHGLSYALAVGTPPPANNVTSPPPDVAHLSCHGEPAPTDQPHKGSCNPYQGDSSCRLVLPVLCFRPGALPQPPGVVAGTYRGWTGGTIGATQPVMGAILASEAAGHQRCERELGAGWRMAEFHDAEGGWGLQGARGPGLQGRSTRYWVHINDQKGNCWNSGG